MQQYCNIDGAEVKIRKIAGYISMLMGIVFYAIGVIMNFGLIWSPIIFICFYVGALSLLESRNKFCVIYGIQGVEILGEERKKTEAKRVKRYSNIAKIVLISGLLSILFTTPYLLYSISV